MSKLALAGFAASLLAAPAATPTGAWAQEATAPPDPASPDARPVPKLEVPPPPGPQPQSAAKTKITGGMVAEAGGGVAGGMLAKGVGTAVAGPVGGVAASFLGSRLGSGAVRMIRRVFRREAPADSPPRRAAAAPPPAEAPS